MNRFVVTLGTHILALQKSLQGHPSQVLNGYEIFIILKEYECIEGNITDKPLSQTPKVFQFLGIGA
jgi:hypothetical protein